MDSYSALYHTSAAYLIFSPLSITGESIDCIEVNGTDILIRKQWADIRRIGLIILGKLTIGGFIENLQNHYFPPTLPNHPTASNPETFISVFTINASKSFRA
jgi:hypothetical protein